MSGVDKYRLYLNKVIQCMSNYSHVILRDNAALVEIMGVAQDIGDLGMLDDFFILVDGSSMFFNSKEFLNSAIYLPGIDRIKNSNVNDDIKEKIIQNCGNLLLDGFEIVDSPGQKSVIGFDDSVNNFYSNLSDGNSGVYKAVEGMLGTSIQNTDDEEFEEDFDYAMGMEEEDEYAMNMDDEDDEEEDEEDEYDMNMDDEEEDEDEYDMNTDDEDDEEEDEENEYDMNMDDEDDEEEDEENEYDMGMDDEDDEDEDEEDDEYYMDTDAEEDIDYDMLMDDEDDEEDYADEDPPKRKDSNLKGKRGFLTDNEYDLDTDFGSSSEVGYDASCSGDFNEENIDNCGNLSKKRGLKDKCKINGDINLSFDSKEKLKSPNDMLADQIIDLSNKIVKAPNKLKGYIRKTTELSKSIYNGMKVDDE